MAWTNTRPPAEARGYGHQHRKLRAQYKARLNNGEIIPCCRCGKPIDPNHPWALDHTEDRQGYDGISHDQCNSSHGLHLAQQARAKQRAKLTHPSRRRP